MTANEASTSGSPRRRRVGRQNTERLDGARVSVLGLGASGSAAARLALAKGGKVYASDCDRDAAPSDGIGELVGLGASVELGGHDVERIVRSEIIVVSPGIPPSAPILGELSRRGRLWISEPDFAIRFHDGSLIAVTGTNGKTTTATLTAHLMKRAGMSVALGGNVGGGLAPAASRLALDVDPAWWWVLELSSFQLGAIDRLRPDVAVVTNLAPDHQDRYPDPAAYYADKARLALNADEDTSWVLPHGDLEVTRTFGSAPGSRFYFDASDAGGRGRAGHTGAESSNTRFATDRTGPAGAVEPETGVLSSTGPHAFLSRNRLCLLSDLEASVRGPGTSAARIELLRRKELPLLGRHNVANALAALLASRRAGADAGKLADALRTAPLLPHRLAPVSEIRGVLWVNDSKATNLAAARSAIASLDRPIVLIAGGKDKSEDLSGLVRPGDGVKAVIAMGEAGPRLAGELSFAPTFLEPGLAEAVARARTIVQSGDCVLLSPACPSFDEFTDYAARGDAFHGLVEAEA